VREDNRVGKMSNLEKYISGYDSFLYVKILLRH